MDYGFFITGTDTSVGKTWATVTLMRYFQAQGKTVVGMKPIASGCECINGELRNEDALMLQENASVTLDYDLVNPYAYLQPVSPHLAGEENPVNLNKVVAVFSQIKQKADVVLVEGVGGWLVPLNHQGDDVQAMAKALDLPVILVVAIRLGCLNHALLTYQAIISSGLACRGWLATTVDADMQKQNENIATLRQLISAPLLGILPYSEKADFNLFIKTIDFI